MNWKLILSLALINVLLGLMTILGLLGSTATWIGLLILVVMAVVLGRFAEKKYFMHGFLTGVIGSMVAAIIQFAMYDTYVANNPELAQSMDQLQEMFPSFDGSWMTLLFAPLGAAFNGAILGLLAILGGKIFGSKESPVAEPADDKTVE